MGTPFEINTEGKILFLEDVGEEPHSIDSMLTQLKLAGKLDKVAGIIVGDCVDCIPGRSKRNRMELNHSILRMLREFTSDLAAPVLYGLRFGHSNLKLTLPLGVSARLSVRSGDVKFEILEEATSDE